MKEEVYSLTAKAAAKAAVIKVPYACGGLIEAEIHHYLEHTIGMDPKGTEIDEIADHALSVAGIILGVGPDSL